MIYLELPLSNISERSLKDAIKALPEWRKAQAMRFKHTQGRIECTYSYHLLCEALRKIGIEDQPTFVYDERGKPHMKEYPSLYFNLSHCKVAVACVVASYPVGIDVEMLGRYSERLARYSMNNTEIEEIKNSSNPDLAFTRLWTRKEATAKLTGAGISTNVRHLLDDTSNIIYKTTVNTEKKYVLTVASMPN